MKESWILLGSELKFKDRLFSIRHDRYRFKRNQSEKDYSVIDTSDWVNIIPITSRNEIILIRQYRHGVMDTVIEIPGGCIDHEDPSPEYAARRELLEETGYTSDNFIHLGTVSPNPAIQSNKCYFFLAKDVHKISEQNFDPNEEIELFFVPEKEIGKMIRKGEINHSLVIDAFCFFMLQE